MLVDTGSACGFGRAEALGHCRQRRRVKRGTREVSLSRGSCRSLQYPGDEPRIQNDSKATPFVRIISPSTVQSASCNSVNYMHAKLITASREEITPRMPAPLSLDGGDSATARAAGADAHPSAMDVWESGERTACCVVDLRRAKNIDVTTMAQNTEGCGCGDVPSHRGSSHLPLSV